MSVTSLWWVPHTPSIPHTIGNMGKDNGLGKPAIEFPVVAFCITMYSYTLIVTYSYLLFIIFVSLL